MPVTAATFRELALALPEVEERSHQGHPDFRVGGKVFATLGPDGGWGMVKLPPDEQTARAEADPEAFEPFPGAWGRQGCTRVTLGAARKPSVQACLVAAWRNTAPKRMLQEHDP
jgi:hypothetical protein